MHFVDAMYYFPRLISHLSSNFKSWHPIHSDPREQSSHDGPPNHSRTKAHNFPFRCTSQPCGEKSNSSTCGFLIYSLTGQSTPQVERETAITAYLPSSSSVPSSSALPPRHLSLSLSPFPKYRGHETKDGKVLIYHDNLTTTFVELADLSTQVIACRPVSCWPAVATALASSGAPLHNDTCLLSQVQPRKEELEAEPNRLGTVGQSSVFPGHPNLQRLGRLDLHNNLCTQQTTIHHLFQIPIDYHYQTLPSASVHSILRVYSTHAIMDYEPDKESQSYLFKVQLRYAINHDVRVYRETYILLEPADSNVHPPHH